MGLEQTTPEVLGKKKNRETMSIEDLKREYEEERMKVKELLAEVLRLEEKLEELGIKNKFDQAA